jgi:hypothetical protein
MLQHAYLATKNRLGGRLVCRREMALRQIRLRMMLDVVQGL